MTNIFNDTSAGTGSFSTGIDVNCVIGSILFCLALNWKQMALYYAPAVFAYLLGRCFAPYSTSSSYDNSSTFQVLKRGLTQILILGITVLGTFGILWFPFYHYRDDNDESIRDVFGVLLRRIFPFSR